MIGKFYLANDFHFVSVVADELLDEDQDVDEVYVDSASSLFNKEYISVQ